MNNLKNRILTEIPKYWFVLSLCIVMFCYGYVVRSKEIFPYRFINTTYKILRERLTDNLDWVYVKREDINRTISIYDKDKAYNGLSLVTSITTDNKISAKIMDMDGIEIHKWNVDWFDVWPDAKHIPKYEKPKSMPGTHIHGAIVLENGNLIYNYEHLGLVCMDISSNILWKLPYRTHHSIYLDESDNLWVCGKKKHETYSEPTILKISLDGNILEEISVIELLKTNDLYGLLYDSHTGNAPPQIFGDVLHLNDVEPFPSSMTEGVFEIGDVMISLRDISAIIIFNEKTRKIKFVEIKGFVRQHDPDFIDGNTISIFDNNYIELSENSKISRIIIKSFSNDSSSIYYSGNDEKSFYSSIMGKHQWLPNGNLLITESMKGRAFEIDKNGMIVWEYNNIVGDEHVGIVEEVQRLPRTFTKEFFLNR